MRWLVAVIISALLLLGAHAPSAHAGNLPVHTITTAAVTSAGWKNIEVLATDQEGAIVAWSIRANAACTSTSFVPYLVDKVTASGTATPSAAPPAEYRIASESSVSVTASAVEPSFDTSFTEVMPFTGGLRLWLNITGGTTCTYTLSTWWLK